MYQNKRILALITARGGSKGIIKKNIKLLADKPLLCWTIDEAKKSKHIDRLILSSDDDEIINIALQAGCEVPFRRPAVLAEDKTSSMDVITHALDQLEDIYDYLLLLQPTSPFRNVTHINEIIEKAIETQSNLMVSVSEVKKHPSFMYSLEKNCLIPVLPFNKHRRRQDMSKIYEHNGALYFSKISFLKKTKSYNSPEACAYVMNHISSVDLDTLTDWKFAEYLIKEGVIK